MSDRLRTSPLDTEHLDEERMLPERVVELEAAGHPVDVLEHHLVVNDKPDDDSTGYIVTEIETTPVPDESAAPITLFVCHCAHAHYRVFDWSSVGGPDGAHEGDDKHVDRVLRSEKCEREVDEDQVTLADGGVTAPMCPACETRMRRHRRTPRHAEQAASWECPECGRAPVPDGGQLLEGEPEADLEPVDVDPIEVNRIASEAVADADGQLPDFDVFCAVVEETQDTLLEVIGR